MWQVYKIFSKEAHLRPRASEPFPEEGPSQREGSNTSPDSAAHAPVVDTNDHLRITHLAGSPAALGTEPEKALLLRSGSPGLVCSWRVGLQRALPHSGLLATFRQFQTVLAHLVLEGLSQRQKNTLWAVTRAQSQHRPKAGTQ